MSALRYSLFLVLLFFMPTSLFASNIIVVNNKTQTSLSLSNRQTHVCSSRFKWSIPTGESALSYEALAPVSGFCLPRICSRLDADLYASPVCEGRPIASVQISLDMKSKSRGLSNGLKNNEINY